MTKSDQKCTAAQNEQIGVSEQKKGQILFSESEQNFGRLNLKEEKGEEVVKKKEVKKEEEEKEGAGSAQNVILFYWREG